MMNPSSIAIHNAADFVRQLNVSKLSELTEKNTNLNPLSQESHPEIIEY